MITLLSGFARNIVHLVIAQMLVSANEAGDGPTMNSLISDLFERATRRLPVGVCYCGISLGAFVGFTLGSYLADSYGWRMTFILLGAPGLLAALLVLLTVRETPRGMYDRFTRAPARPDFPGTLRFLNEQKALRHSVIAQALTGMAQMGPIGWLVSFLHRSHDASFAVAGSVTGLIFLITGLASAPAGGLLMDRMSVRDVRWNGWLCAEMMLVSAVAFSGIYLVPTLTMAFVMVFAWQLIINAVSPIMVTMVANSPRRSFAACRWRSDSCCSACSALASDRS